MRSEGATPGSLVVSGAEERPAPMRYGSVRRAIAKYGVLASDLLAFVIAFFAVRQAMLPAPLRFYEFDAAGNVLTVRETGFDWFLIPSVLFIAYMFLAGGYSRRQPFWDEMRVVLQAVAVLAVVDFAVLELGRTPGPPALKLGFWVGMALVIPVGRLLTKYLLSAVGVWQIPSVIIGTGPLAVESYRMLRQEPLLGYDIRAFIEPDPAGTAGYLDIGTRRLPVFKPDGPLADFVFALGTPHVVQAVDAVDAEPVSILREALIARGHVVDVVPPLKGVPLFGLETSHMFGREIVLMRTRNNLARPTKRAIKRAFDLLVASLLLVVCAPLFAVVALLIRLEDGGPVFFRQERMGLRGRAFACLKFRSMRINAESVLSRWKTENPELYAQYVAGNFKLQNDPRVTRIGRFIRVASIDELPQLFNVIRGQMSLVGPRPLLRSEMEPYGSRIALYRRVLPGITGVWQISGRSDTTFEERALYDDWYIKNWSLWYDIVILIKTLPAVLGRTGAH